MIMGRVCLVGDGVKARRSTLIVSAQLSSVQFPNAIKSMKMQPKYIQNTNVIKSIKILVPAHLDITISSPQDISSPKKGANGLLGSFVYVIFFL